MRELVTTTAFKKDLKRARERGKDPEKLRNVIGKLLADEPLERKFKAHRLVGKIAPLLGMPYRAVLAPSLG